MSKWPHTRLGNVVRPVERGESPLAGTVYRQIGVKLWGAGAYEREPLDGSQTKYSQLFRAEAGDVIVNKIWARNGSVAVVSDALAGCFGSSEFPMFKPDTDKVSPRWLHWLTKTRDFWVQCDEKSRGTSGQNRIKPEQFLNVEIPLPPLADQRRIVMKIEELSAQIYEARALRQHAAVEADAILSTAAGRAFDCACESYGTDRLGDLCTQITDGTHLTPRYIEAGVPFLSVKDITSGTIRFDRVRYISPEEHAELTKRCKPDRDDVLLTKVGTTGFAKVIDVDREFSIFVSLALLKLDRRKLDPVFAEHMLNSSRLREYSARGTRGVGNKNLVLKFIRDFPMPVPSLPEQRRIVAELNALGTEVGTLKHLQAGTADELDALLPAILNRAFYGAL